MGWCIYNAHALNGTEEEAMKKRLTSGKVEIEKFFSAAFPHQFSVYIFPNRAALDQQWQQDWGVPDFKSECWMVASGVARRLDILSPGVWKTEACEHDAANEAELQKLITHEMIHVYHGQHNPHPDFAGMDDMGWLVEGMATYVSGQLSERRISTLKTKIASGNGPQQLEDFWKGAEKYGQSGSLMQFIDQKYGRKTIIALLKTTTEKEALDILKVSEKELIEVWKRSIL